MKKRADALLALAGVVCAVLMMARWVSVFRGGVYVGTSGAEEESLFAIWKWTQGQAVYGPAFRPPFAISYFNWLFYWVYGGFTLMVSSLLKPDASALPSIVRALTVMLTCAAGVLGYVLLAPLNVARRMAGGMILALNPLIGFWSVTARPDIGALVCDLTGLWCVAKAGSTSRDGWLFGALAAFYGAWAFKQSYVAALVAACLYLLLNGKRKQALLLAAGAALLFGVTLSAGSADYRYAVLLSQKGLLLVPRFALHNTVNALVKAPLLGAGLIAIATGIRRVARSLFALAGLTSFAMMVVASAKMGASDSYFFESAAFCSLAFLMVHSDIAISAGAIAQMAPVALIFAGLAGAVTTDPHPELALLQARLATLPRPVVVTTGSGNLPWFQRKPPYMLLLSTYWLQLERNETLAFGGVAGMIRSGLIKVVVCPRREAGDDYYGIVPRSLKKIDEDSYWDYFSTGEVQ